MDGGTVTTVTIYPEPENVKVIARLLTDLADHNTQVEYVMWPEPGFRVPEHVADKFLALWDDKKSTEGGDTVEDTPEPVKRKPGRPKKNVEGQ